MAAHLSGVDYGASPRGQSSGLVRPVRWIVLHATANTASARDEAHFAATRTDARSRWTSAHFYVDEREIIGSVPLNREAWAAYSEANSHGWHIEMCGRSDHVPAAVIARTAGLVRRLADLDDVPIRHCTPSMVAAHERGICGHRDITIGLDVGDHTDPGPHFDWSAFIAAVANREDDDVSGKDVWDETKWPDFKGKPVAARYWMQNADIYAGRAWQETQAIRAEQAAAKLRDEAILAAVKGDSDDAILARIDQRADELKAAQQQLRVDLADQFAHIAVPQLVEAVRAQVADVPEEALTAAVHAALVAVAAQVAGTAPGVEPGGAAGE